MDLTKDNSLIESIVSVGEDEEMVDAKRATDDEDMDNWMFD